MSNSSPLNILNTYKNAFNRRQNIIAFLCSPKYLAPQHALSYAVDYVKHIQHLILDTYNTSELYMQHAVKMATIASQIMLSNNYTDYEKARAMNNLVPDVLVLEAAATGQDTNYARFSILQCQIDKLHALFEIQENEIKCAQ